MYFIHRNKLPNGNIMEKKTYKEWIKEVWTEAGGLITQSMAADIIGVTRQQLLKK
jgi:hypothetical protein